MALPPFLFWCILLLSCSLLTSAELTTHTLTVSGTERTYLVFVPPNEEVKPLPLILAFHGHGGSSAQASRSFALHKEWREALVIYPQGLPTVGRLTDPEGKKNGWQSKVGDYADRDLLFVDALLVDARNKFPVDNRRIYVTGHSNGGGFTYLLGAQRGGQFTALAPSAALDRKALTTLAPIPILHLAGKNDALVKFAWQSLMIDAIKKKRQCGAGEPWGDSPFCTRYPAADGADLITCIHDGTHTYPDFAPKLIVKFFQSYPRPETTP